MVDYQTLKFDPQLTITAVPYARKETLSDDTWRLIESTWQEEGRRIGSRLFNGAIFSLTKFDHQDLEGSFVEYKLYLAQARNPQLEDILNIRPLSVSGLTRSGGRILFAQRSETVAHNPLRYELAPSGGIDPSSLVGNQIEISKQLAIELQEETGLTKELIKEIRPFALILDKRSKVTEICAEVILTPNAEETIDHPIDEYIQFFWVHLSDLALFISRNHEKIVPMSLHILHLKKLI